MPIELISTLRKKINFHSTLLIILVTVLMVVLFAVRFIISFDNKFLEGVLMMSFIVLVATAGMIIARKSSRLKALGSDDMQSIIASLEFSLEKEQIAFRKTYQLRFIIGTAFTISMLLLIIFGYQ